MKAAYPILLNEGAKRVVVYIPDFTINTQGADITDAIEMARDAIGLMGIDIEDDGETIPPPSPIGAVVKERESDVVTLVDVDFAAYRRANDQRTVRRNVTLPSWLNSAAEKANVNVSAILQAALKSELERHQA